MIFSLFPCGIQRQSCDELGRVHSLINSGIINEFEIHLGQPST